MGRNMLTSIDTSEVTTAICCLYWAIWEGLVRSTRTIDQSNYAAKSCANFAHHHNANVLGDQSRLCIGLRAEYAGSDWDPPGHNCICAVESRRVALRTASFVIVDGVGPAIEVSCVLVYPAVSSKAL